MYICGNVHLVTWEGGGEPVIYCIQEKNNIIIMLQYFDGGKKTAPRPMTSNKQNANTKMPCFTRYTVPPYTPRALDKTPELFCKHPSPIQGSGDDPNIYRTCFARSKPLSSRLARYHAIDAPRSPTRMVETAGGGEPIAAITTLGGSLAGNAGRMVGERSCRAPSTYIHVMASTRQARQYIDT